MKHLRYFPLMGISLLCAGLQTSCIDNDYDLDNTDYTLGIETNLTLPTCSTGDIYLRNFMDLEEDGVIQYVWDEQLQDSIFCVRETGSANVDPIRIDKITIPRPTLSQIETTINLNDMFNPSNTRKKIKVTIENPIFGNQEIDVADQNFIYDFQEGDAIKYAMSNASAENISADVVSIENVGFEQAVEVTLSIQLNGFPPYIPLMHLDDLKLSYPTDLNISKCVFNGKECPIKNGTIILSEGKGGAIEISKGLTLVLIIEGIETGKAFVFDAINHRVDLSGDFTLNGAFRVESSEFDTTELNKKINSLTFDDVQAFLGGNWNGLIPASIGVKGEAEFDKDIVIKTFTGDVTHDVGSIAPIKLDDLPDFLNDDEVVLDLANPILLFTATHDLPSTALTNITLKSSTYDTPVKTADISIEYGTNKYYIADETTNALPENYTGATPVPFNQDEGGSIRNLIKKIPEQIDISVAPVKLHAQDLDITQSYNVDIDYEVFAPFTFGPEFNLVYSDTENGWAKDLDDMEDLNAGQLELKGKADSDLPADCILTLIPIDKNGKEITALEVNSVTVNGNAKDTPIDLTIKAAQGYSLNDVLTGKNGVNQLDGVKYTARLKGANGQTMKKNASIRLHGMQVTIKGTLSYDAN